MSPRTSKVADLPKPTAVSQPDGWVTADGSRAASVGWTLGGRIVIERGAVSFSARLRNPAKQSKSQQKRGRRRVSGIWSIVGLLSDLSVMHSNELKIAVGAVYCCTPHASRTG